MKTICKKTLINITEGNNITLHATLLRDEELFPVEMSTDVTASLLAIGVDIPLTMEIPSAGTVIVEIPSTVAPGNYVLGISGTLAGQNWRTASEVLRITTLTESGNSQVTVVGDDYDITMQVQLYSADIATAIEHHNTDEEAHPYILQQLGTKQDTISDLQTIREGAAAGATAYQKPSSGIPSSDMTEAVQTSLSKADSALQEHQSLAGYYTKEEVNTIVSPFITKTVDDLTNYYLKTDVYTQNEVQQLIAAISQFQYQIAQTLPTASADTMRIIYLVPSTNPQQQNVKDEFITIDNGSGATIRYTWEQIGSTEIDLSGYYTSAQTDTAISNALTTALQSYYNKTEMDQKLANKQDTITDLSTIRSGAEAGATAYQKPSIGIPQTDLTSALSTKIDNAVNAVSLTYSQLTTLISNEELIPGTYYRITDYVTTTAADYTQSAGHAFDVVVLALDASTLDCNAMAIQHEGDTYFNSADLSKWELKYDINNDTSKYDWADATNGKGVIYWMRDEHAIECPYDFKNIQFLRFANVKHAFHVPNQANTIYTSMKDLLITMESGSNDNPTIVKYAPDAFTGTITWYNDYSSVLSSLTFSDGFQFEQGKYYKILFNKSAATSHTDMIVVEVDQAGEFFYTFDIKGSDASVTNADNIYNVRIGENKEGGKFTLPDTIFITKSNSIIGLNNFVIGRGVHNTFGLSSNNTNSHIVRAMYSAIARVTFSIAGTLDATIAGFPFYSNIAYIGGTVISNNLSYCNVTAIQGSAIVNSSNSEFAGRSNRIYVGTNCGQLILTGNCYDIVLGDNSNTNTLMNCHNIVLGTGCKKNSFKEYCHDIIAGNSLENSIFGPECNNIVIGQDVSNLQDYAQAIEVDATTCYVNIYATTATSSTTYLNRIVVKNSASGTSTTPKDISTTAGNSYITTFRGANDIDLVV